MKTINELLDDYFVYFSFSKSKSTAENYRYKLRYFFKFINKIEIEKQDVFFIFSKIASDGRSAGCTSLMYSALKFL